MQQAHSWLPGHSDGGADPLQPLLDRCERLGERFPLLLARIACRMLTGDPTAAQALQAGYPKIHVLFVLSDFKDLNLRQSCGT